MTYKCKICKQPYHLYEDLRGGACFDCLYDHYRRTTAKKRKRGKPSGK